MALFYVYYAIQKDGTPKVGASNNPNGRKRGCKYQEIILLEAYDCPIKCGDREIELQLKYFGKRDSNHHYAVFKRKMSESNKHVWENQRERMMKNIVRGINQASSKLTEQDVRFIRKVYYKVENQNTPIPKGKMRRKQLADKFNCSTQTILRVVSGKGWKHVK